jgi:hypothetical protein
MVDIGLAENTPPSFGIAIAQLFERSIHASVARLGPRYEEALRRTERQLYANDLIWSHPMDEYVSAVVVSDGLVDKRRIGMVIESVEPEKVKSVKIEWLGDNDATLWNFVRAVPGSATVEEVAAALYNDPAKSIESFAITKRGDVFEVNESHARSLVAKRNRLNRIAAADRAAADAADPQKVKAKQQAAAQAQIHHAEMAVSEFGAVSEPGAHVTEAELREVQGHIMDELSDLSRMMMRLGLLDCVVSARALAMNHFKQAVAGDAALRALRAQCLPIMKLQQLQFCQITKRLRSMLNSFCIWIRKRSLVVERNSIHCRRRKSC